MVLSQKIKGIFLGAIILMNGCNKGSSGEENAKKIDLFNKKSHVDSPHHGGLFRNQKKTGSDHGYGRKQVPPSEIIEKLPQDGGPEFNRLVFEKSPYLLQHAGNPVDWYPWGQEAFNKAVQENKPIFLSVGYSTCHWCHVMERESFEISEVGRILNDHYVSIKVDREERPDVDKVYMTYLQALPGANGGWPMSIWLTPNLKPFHGGTYFPPEDSYGRPGFKSILIKLAKLWETHQSEIVASGNSVVEQLQSLVVDRTQESVIPNEEILDIAYEKIKNSYESRYGGFGSAPKFPRPSTPNYLLRYYEKTGKRDALHMVLFTLKKMADGGMYDHIGGGFHRYSVDNRWHVPHFEKMLYDQGQLVCTYLDAYQVTDDLHYLDVAKDILKYVKRDMIGTQGQFYSAEDADSPIPENPLEQSEGAFYVWTYQQVIEALGETASSIFNHYYGIKKEGNVGSDPHNEFFNKNVLIVSDTLENTAERFQKTPEQIKTLLAKSRDKLFYTREARPHPHLDDKTLTAWNGLMISAFSRAAQVLNDNTYLEVAERATKFIRDHLYNLEEGTLMRRYRHGDSDIEGYVDDYAYFIQALLDLYESSFNINYLTWAINLQNKQNELFYDEHNGGYYNTSGTDDSIIIRIKESYDGAEPSPNSISLMNLLRISQMTNDDTFKKYGEKTLSAFSRILKETPHAMPQMLAAFYFYLAKPMQIIIAGNSNATDTRKMIMMIHKHFLPNKILLLADGAKGQKILEGYLPFFSNISMLKGKATAYVCENYTCKSPTHDIEIFIELISGMEKEETDQEKRGL